MYKIGEFSKLARTTIKTLRYYEQVELLNPSFIDDNGYRYYEGKDLIVLNKIDEDEAREQILRLQSIFGPHCLESTNDLYITANEELVFFTGPDDIIEGRNGQYNLIVIGNEGTVEYFISNYTRHGIEIDNRIGILTTTLNNEPDDVVTVTAIFTVKNEPRTIIRTKTINILKETYEKKNTFIIADAHQPFGFRADNLQKKSKVYLPERFHLFRTL